MHAAAAALVLSCTSVAPVVGREVVGPAAAVTGFTIRDAARSELWPVATLVHDSFAAREPSFLSPAPLVGVQAAITTARLALDIERRATPWDWARHRQLVAEDSSSGELVGFVEVWGEDADSMRREEAVTPQPCLFNLCVAPAARRRGVGRALIARCEELCGEWGEAEMYLKVRLRGWGVRGGCAEVARRLRGGCAADARCLRAVRLSSPQDAMLRRPHTRVQPPSERRS